MPSTKLSQEQLDEMIADEALLDLAVDAEGNDLADDTDPIWDGASDDADANEPQVRRICSCTAGEPADDCDFESHRPGANDPTRPFAGLTIDNSNPVLTEAATVEWLHTEYDEGRKAGQRWLTEHKMSLDDVAEPEDAGLDSSLPFKSGFLAIVTTWQDGDCPQGFTKAHLMRKLHQEFSFRRHDEATRLSKDSAEASMTPLGVGHWDAEEIAGARGVIEDWCRWTGKGWSPIMERSVEFEIEDWKASAKAHGRVVVQDDAIKDRVQELLKEWATNEQLRLIVGNRPSKRTDISMWLGHEMEADALQFVFVLVPEGSRAALRGERVWAIAYYPNTYTRADGSEGSGWYNLDGHVGVARTWSSLVAAKDDFRSLLAAVMQVRKHGKQLLAVGDESEDWFKAIQAEEDEAAKPSVGRANVPTL